MDKFILFLKSLMLQSLFSKDDMQRHGFKCLTNGSFDEHINTNPFFATVIAGIIKNNPQSAQKVRFIAPISAMLGDDLFWNLLKPVTLYSSLILFLLFKNWLIIIPLIFYNIIIFLLRYKGFDYGASKADRIKLLYCEWYFKKVQKPLHRAKVFLFGILSVFLVLMLINYLQKHILYGIILGLILTLSIALKSRAFLLIGVILMLLNLARL
ncbi:TPA: hypothetical protein DCW38_00875 [candidate division WOR-3 bacterium]|jgi:hypothetical protein|uniref:Uncharacterized protein n=1 Tax=candidate division WOR-3 bacterium TaxID=2052148 RepID=A0A350H857_UNCW3|nr:hypothetical protein [candidate division WOR-3 bacterium]